MRVLAVSVSAVFIFGLLPVREVGVSVRAFVPGTGRVSCHAHCVWYLLVFVTLFARFAWTHGALSSVLF